MTTVQGALPALRAATDPNAKGGELYGPRYTTFGAAVRRPTLRPGLTNGIDRVWEVSERETGLAINVFGDTPD
ncbi:MAG: hypothetical protein ACR2QO_27440 [Acidimicrobiales bacterium]